jgi:PAS domain S-box-containing protein
VGIIFLTAFLLLLLIFELLQVVQWSDHSYVVLGQTRTCENLVVETQNDVRGYLLTGDPTFLVSYNAGKAQIDEAFKKLISLVADNPEQAIRAEDLDLAKNTWMDHARTMISQRSKTAAVNSDWVRMGKTILDDITARFDKFIAVEEDLDEARHERVRRMKRALAYGGGGLVIVLAATIAHLMRKQLVDLAANYRTALNTIEQRHAALARSETDLEAQKERLRVTLTSIGDGVIVTDHDGRVILMNHESERLTGWPYGEAMHQPLSVVFKIIDETTRRAEPIMERILQEKQVIDLSDRTVLLSRTGEQWPLEDSAAPIYDAEGKILGVVIVFHDATQRRLAQASLKAHSADLEKKVAERTATLQQAISELEAFSYTVSHDLRSPLRAMQGFSEAVLEDYGDKLDEQGKVYLERIRSAGVRLDKLILDLLSYTRVSRHGTPLEAIDLDQAIRDYVQREPHLNPPLADVRIEGTLPKVLACEPALSQVISNLLGNAAKFVPAGKIPEIRVWTEERGNQVRLWIEDNGIGIPPKDRERIFQMFVQLNQAEAYEGTGVGLAIVAKAAQTMRGSVGVESKDGAGSRFWVDLTKAA